MCVVDEGSFKEYKPCTVTPKTLLKMSADMEKYVYGSESQRYLREVRTTYSVSRSLNHLKFNFSQRETSSKLGVQ